MHSNLVQDSGMDIDNNYEEVLCRETQILC